MGTMPLKAQTPLPTTVPIATEVVTEAIAPAMETMVAPQPEIPIVIQQPENNTAIIGLIVAVIMSPLMMGIVSVMNGRSIVEAGKLTAAGSVQGIISSAEVSQSVETGLNHIPESLRNVLASIVDVFDPLTATTQSDLDNRTQQWIKNMLDADPATGAVVVETADPAMNPNPPVG